MKKALYIHIPFCRKKCAYCDFYSITYSSSLASNYINALVNQIMVLNGDFSTIFIGGGTPSILCIDLLKRLLNSLRKISLSAEEFTIEVNPESLTIDKIKLFIDQGVNRLSIGAQSFIDDKLVQLGRLHSVKEAISSVALAKRGGFNNINIDLIFGVWDQTLNSWEKELQMAVRLPITHISCYALTIEKDTPLYYVTKNNRTKIMKDGEVAAMYKFAMKSLPKNGFFQYEVSNFSRKGFECRHNLHYWDNGSYVGLGPSAVSCFSQQREKNIDDIQRYTTMVVNGKSPVVLKDRLSKLKKAKETAVLSLRTKKGLNFDKFKQDTGFNFLEIEKDNLKKLISEGLLRYKLKNRKKIGMSVTRKGFLFSDTVSRELL